MADIKTDTMIKDICSVTIDSLKRLAAEGKKLDQNSLYSTMSKNKNFVESLETFNGYDDESAQSGSEFQSLTFKFKDEIDSLKSDLERNNQKNTKLMSQLRELEDEFDSRKEFYEKSLMVLTDLLRNANNKKLSFEIKQFKSLIFKKAGIELLEKSFLNIKNSALLETVDDDESSSKSGKGKK